MAEKNNKTGFWLVLVAIVFIAVIITLTIVKRQPAEQPVIESPVQQLQPAETAIEKTSPPLIGSKPPVSPKLNLIDVVKDARTWGPAYDSWYGKTAPDFTVTDLAEKQHKLSDYRGKNVILVFWATWCQPCIVEIPHLIALQNIVGKEKLAILAISPISYGNTAEMVKNFVEQNKKINYSVFATDASTMPAPFNYIPSIPCSFFIDPQGKIKLATQGLLSLPEMRAILSAEWP